MDEMNYWRVVAENALSCLFDAYWHNLVACGWNDTGADDEANIDVCNNVEISDKELDFIMHGELDKAYAVHCGEDIDY